LEVPAPPLSSRASCFTINIVTLVLVAVAFNALVLAVRAGLPPLSFRGGAVVDALLLCGGRIGTGEEVARHLGLRNRFELARLLKHEGLPPLHDLAAWMSVLSWLDRAEDTGYSLCHMAFRARMDPASCYRTVKRMTGVGWQELRERGAIWAVKRFAKECGANA